MMPAGPSGSHGMAQAGTGIRLHSQGSGWYNTAMAPLINIDRGRIVTPALAMGSVEVALPPGQHWIAVECRSWKAYGLASMSVHVQPGRMTDVYYAAPANVFSNGRIGLTPQRRVGGGFLVAIVLIPVFILVFLFMIPLLFLVG